MLYPGCPLCQGAVAALVGLIIGPAGAAVAKKDPLCMGIFFVWMPLAGLQALGHYRGEWTIVQSLHIDQLFIPEWIHTGFALIFLLRVFQAWRQGRLDKLAASAKAIAEE